MRACRKLNYAHDEEDLVEMTFCYKNWSYDFRRPLALFFVLASIQDLLPLDRINDESIVETGLDAVIDLNVPIFQGSTDGFNLRIDRALNIGQDRP